MNSEQLKAYASLAEVPTDAVLDRAFVYGKMYPERRDFNMFMHVWVERIARGEL